MIKKLIASLSCLVLLSCGFHLRGLALIPFESVYIGSSNPSTTLDIKRKIEASSKTIVLDSPRNAQATLQIIQAINTKTILSVSGTGRVREYQLHYFLSFQILDRKGLVIIPVTKIRIDRVLPFSDSAFLSSEMEEKMLVKEMQADAIIKMMDRIGKVDSLN